MKIIFKPSKKIPSPSAYKLEYPPLLRVELLLQMAMKIRSGSNEFTSSEMFKSMSFLQRVDLMLMGMEGLFKIALEFENEALRISRGYPQVADLYDLEKRGNSEIAKSGYETLISAGFIGSMPYDRLRIIYTREKDYSSAIRVCHRYTFVLKQLSTIQPNASNLRLIPDFEEWARKLEGKSNPAK
jgi:hypothetical protein